VKTSQDLFKQLDEAESLFSKGSIKVAQKKVRDVMIKSKELDKVPNKLRHKLNFAIGQSRYFDDMSSFATNPKREELIKEISIIIETPLESRKEQAHLIHEIQTKWQLLDLSSRPASKEQWNIFNELTNKAWEPCSEYFDELKQIKVNNALQRNEIINNVNKYVGDNSSNWPQPKFLIQFLRQSFDEWQRYAPVLDKDLYKLRNAYFAAKKPINDAIKKQEQIVIKAKEALIEKVNAISDEDNDICIKKFNDLKNEWKKAGSAGRKTDNKLWDKFNKSADRFFNAKKEVIDSELKKANELLSQLKSDEISVNEVSKSLSDLKNIFKTKEFNSIQKQINNKRKEQETKLKQNKIESYINLLDAFLKNELDNTQIPSSIKNKLNDKPQEKSTTEALTYACIKLEALAGIDSLKKDAELRQSVQMEMLTNKFNKVSDKLNTLDDLLIHFINNISSKPTAAEKTLWKRVSKTFEILI
jgi:Spy/CpxP family protein refolding chaperone